MRSSFVLVLAFSFLVGCRSRVQDVRVDTVSASDAVTVTDVRFPSKSIDDILWYRIVVPKVEPGVQLPVLYLLHGANSSPIELMERSDVVKLASLQHLIVVMPEAGLSYYTNAAHKKNSRWEDAIALDLRDDVATRFT